MVGSPSDHNDYLESVEKASSLRPANSNILPGSALARWLPSQRQRKQKGTLGVPCNAHPVPPPFHKTSPGLSLEGPATALGVVPAVASRI